MTNSTLDLDVKGSLERQQSTFLEYQLTDRFIPDQINDDVQPIALKLYDAANINLLPWPDTEEARFAKRYLVPLIKQGTKYFIDNIDADLRVLQVDSHIIPLLIVKNDYANAYVCSPYAHYISLALESLFVIKSPMLRKAAEKMLIGFGKLLKQGDINQIVYVNHWLLSTDLYPKTLTTQQIGCITAFLKEEFPQYAIAFRSLNAKTNSPLQSSLKMCGFERIASRQIYLTNTKDQALFNTRIIKSDLRLWNDKDYEVIETKQLTSNDYDRILSLYKTVSLEHHSHLNPQLNMNFIKLMIEQGFLKIKALRKNGVIDGIVGYHTRNHIFMCPFFGYDKSHADKNRIYRLLSTLLLLEAAKNHNTFHQSAGASFYKKIRRAAGQQEYMSVYSAHLSLKQRFSWWSLKAVMNTAGPIFMKKY